MIQKFMPNWSCMHLCGHSSIKFLWSCDTRAQDSFSLFKSTQCFQNMLFYQFMPLSESILGVRKKFAQHSPFMCTHIFFKKKPYVLIGEFFQRKIGIYFFSKVSWLFSQKYIYFLFLFVFSMRYFAT